MFRSATFKLTMWYLALAMTISLIFSFALYNVTTNELSLGLKRETQRIYAGLPNFNNRPMPDTDEQYMASAHNIWIKLVGFNIVVFFGSGLASYLLAKRTLQPIEEAHEQQKRFTADVSHELRTPLTSIRMESEVALMNKQLSPLQLKATLESNIEETIKLESLINNLLRLTKLESSELQSNFAEVSLKNIVKQAIKQTKGLASSRQIILSTQIKDDSLLGSEESLVQLLVIILDNAIKYSPKASKVSIDARGETNSVTIEVSDQGIGIDRRSIDKVFDRFYRADLSRSNHVASGTGLGLSIAKTIADLHKGEISISSEMDNGTSVTVKLPKSTT